MPGQNRPYIFICSVSDDLYGASPERSGASLPTPGGGKWLPVDSLKEIGDAAEGFDPSAADEDIANWGCHWFTSHGPCNIYWGPQGPPKHRAKS